MPIPSHPHFNPQHGTPHHLICSLFSSMGFIVGPLLTPALESKLHMGSNFIRRVGGCLSRAWDRAWHILRAQ